MDLISLNENVCTIQENVVTIVSAGTCTILATQPGSHFFNSAPPVQRTFNVESAAATVTITGSLDRSWNGNDQNPAPPRIRPAYP